MKDSNYQEEIITFNSIKNFHNSKELVLQENKKTFTPFKKQKVSIERPPSIFSIPEYKDRSPSGFVQCIIHRGNGIKKKYQNEKIRSNYDTLASTKSIPLKTTSRQRYTLSFQMGSDQTAIIAEKQLLTAYPTYFFYDVTRAAGQFSSNLSKKSGHFIGTLQRTRIKQSQLQSITKSTKRHNEAIYSLWNASGEDILASFIYDIPTFVQQWKEGQPPRKCSVLLAPTDENGQTIPNSSLELSETAKYLKTKEPFYDGGQYRLNFGGRVSTPSVKNMQIEDVDDGGLAAQFGKIGEDSFHLDYKYVK